MKKITAISLALVGFLAFTLPAFAADTIVNACPPDGKGFAALCDLDFSGTLGTVIQIIFVVATIIALAFLIFGGIKWITSGGDKSGVESARNMIVASLVGLVVVFLSFFILNIVLSFFTNSTIFNLTLPSLVP